MIRQPEIYTAKELKEWDAEAEINGKVFPARPVGSNHRSFMCRWCLAWWVLIGKLDALAWGGQQ